MRILNVKQITPAQLEREWNDLLPIRMRIEKHLYVRCNKLGVVNYDKALVYYIDELKNRVIRIH